MSVLLGQRRPVLRFIERVFPRGFDFLLGARAAIQDFMRDRPARQEIFTILGEEPFPLFSNLEIETLNRCNNDCPFCPVNRLEDPRPREVMPKDLFEAIVEQLKQIKYSGRISLYSNNEPLLDTRIFDFHEMVRAALPRAYMCLYTNGILLNVEKFQRLMTCLDRLQIDNYDDGLQLIPSVREIAEFVAENPVYKTRVTIAVQEKTVMRATRGGHARNRRRLFSYRSPCLLPFYQMVVRPDGKLSLCCNDATGSVTLGDLRQSTIVDAWNGMPYREVRTKMIEGRNTLASCRFCDMLPAFFSETDPKKPN